MNKYIFKVILISIFLASCDNANDLLNQYIDQGPIIYAGKINELNTQSGLYRFRVNIKPAEDVNRSYCILSWSITGGVKDSIRIDYSQDNYDNDTGYYYALVEIIYNDDFEGNLEVNAQNFDTFGNRSLIETGRAYIYGSNYISSLINSQVSFSSSTGEIIFEPRVGAVGNLVSYQKNDGSFTQEVFVTENRFAISDAKSGGVVRSKTRYLINETDIDTLEVVEYLETTLP